MKKNKPLKKHIQKYLQDKANPQEKEHVDAFYDAIADEDSSLDEQSPRELQNIESRILAKIHTKQRHTPTKVRTLTKRILRWAAAVLLPLFLLGGYFWQVNNEEEPTLPDILPGRMSASLIIENGDVFSLTSTEDLVKLGLKGVYLQEGIDSQSTVIHEIITPKGGYYQLKLSDGTSIWLNAESSIRFPAHFVGDTREVYLQGEAYFDVKSNENAPFIVHSNLQTTKVFGTQFNVRSYVGQVSDVVTLMEGSVEATSLQNQSVLMEPGYQAHIGKQINYHEVENARDVAAWRNGDFYFDDTPMLEVMQMIGRWYDLDVSPDNLPNNKLNGLVNRNVPLKQLLTLIEVTSDVKIRVKNGQLFIDTKKKNRIE